MANLWKILTELRAEIAANRPLPGRGMHCPRSAAGTQIIFAGGRGDGRVDSEFTPVPVIVTGGTTLTGYTVDVYGNGLGAAATGTALMDPLNIAYADTVPNGTKLWVLPSQLMVVGDGT